MQKRNIEFIYFDVGGVAILDYSKTNKWNEMLDDLGLTGNTREQFENLFDIYESKICLGEDINIFIEEAKTKLKINFPKDYDMTFDFVNRFEKNPYILKLISKLKEKFKLGLLTNQYPNLLNLIFQKELIPSDIWDVIIDSSIEKVAKPELAIYSLAETESNVKPESILFIDNKIDLLDIPKEMGWKTFLYNPADPEISTLELEKYINIIN